MNRVSESTLTKMVADFFSHPGYGVFEEVPVLGQSADLVVQAGSDLTFIEVKVDAVSRAIKQCQTHELVADYICIAVGTKTVSPTNLDEINKRGYGLISCDVSSNECTWLVRPERKNLMWAPVRKQVIERLGSLYGDRTLDDIRHVQ